MKTNETKGSLMKRILKFIGCLALAFAGAGAYGAIWQVATQEALDLALKETRKSPNKTTYTVKGCYDRKHFDTGFII